MSDVHVCNVADVIAATFGRKTEAPGRARLKRRHQGGVVVPLLYRNSMAMALRVLRAKMAVVAKAIVTISMQIASLTIKIHIRIVSGTLPARHSCALGCAMASLYLGGCHT